jgi:hypothetical protein
MILSIMLLSLTITQSVVKLSVLFHIEIHIYSSFECVMLCPIGECPYAECSFAE